MTLSAGSKIGPYELTSDFTAVGNCRWAFARRGERQHFIKEFLRPKYPADYMDEPIRSAKREKCDAFESRHKEVIGALRKYCATGGNIVVPDELFRFGLSYYHVTPKVEITSVATAEIAAMAGRAKTIIAKSLVNCIGVLHRAGIVHCDLKPENVLINKTTAGHLTTKVIDLDASFFDGRPPAPEEMNFDQRYMAPEILHYNKGSLGASEIGRKADVFSLGLMLYEYWTGMQPKFDQKVYSEPASAAIAGALSFDTGRAASKEFIDLVRLMTKADAKDRPSVEAVQVDLNRAMASAPDEPDRAHRVDDKPDVKEVARAEVKFSKKPTPASSAAAPLVRLSSNLKKS